MTPLDRAKRATAEPHLRLERRLDVLSGDTTRRRYADVLAALLGFYAPIERHMVEAPGWARHGMPYEPRLKTPALVADLRVLGHGPEALRARPACRDLPEIAPFPRLLGCAYVLEGATLGGRVMARSVGPRLGLDASAGLAFHSGYGPRTGAMWKAFRAFANRHVRSEADAAAFTAAAGATFDALERWAIAQGL